MCTLPSTSIALRFLDIFTDVFATCPAARPAARLAARLVARPATRLAARPAAYAAVILPLLFSWATTADNGIITSFPALYSASSRISYPRFI